MTGPSHEPDPFGPAFAARIRAGDRGAFEALAEASYERLVRYAYRYIHDMAAAEDVVQDVLFGLWIGRDHLVLRNTMSSYLFGAVRNRALNHLRHQRVEERGEQRFPRAGDPDAWMRSVVSPEDEQEEADEPFEERLAAAQQAVAALSPRQSEAFVLRVEHGMSFAEVAEVMGLSLRSAQTTYLRAVQFLRTRLARYVP